MLDTAEPTARLTGPIKPALHQTGLPLDEVLHSGNAGFIIHRTVQLKYSHRVDGRAVFFDVIRFMNQANLNGASFLVFEELFGTQDRLHWLIHWKSPNDYAISLEMVDHDQELIDLLESDRVEDEGGKGSWGRAVVESSVQEKILVPQHGATGDHERPRPAGLWVDPAEWQTSVPADQLLNTATAPLVVHRVAQAKHDFRKEARYFGLAWQRHVNEKFAGRASSFMYEETFGVMDEIHWLIHLDSFDTYRELMALPDTDPGCQELYERQFVRASRGGGTWARTFVDGSMNDTLLMPYQLRD